MEDSILIEDYLCQRVTPDYPVIFGGKTHTKGWAITYVGIPGHFQQVTVYESKNVRKLQRFVEELIEEADEAA